MTLEDAILCIKGIKSLGHDIFTEQKDFQECLDMAISSLEMQKKLAEFRGMDICKWVEDYDYDEDNTSEYEFEASVDDFLIDEVAEVIAWMERKIPEPYKADNRTEQGLAYADQDTMMPAT